VEYGDPAFLGAALGLSIITGLGSGIYPSLFLASFNPLRVLKGVLRQEGQVVSIRKALVVFQFCLTIVLVTCTIVVQRQMIFIHEKELGFDRENLVLVNLEGELARHRRTVADESLRLPGIRAATVSTTSPLVGGNTTVAVEWPGKVPGEKILFTQMGVGYDYTKTMGITMTAGRDFSRSFPSDSGSFIINEEAARLMNMHDPVGTILTFWNTPGPIIGVMKDYHISSLHNVIQPVILHLNPQWANHLIVRTQAGQAGVPIESLRALTARLNPGYSFEYTFIEEMFERQYKREATVGILASVFTIMAIVISCLGLLGLVAFTGQQRTKEIGVRKVLGASVRNILILLSKEYIILIAAAFAISAPAAWYMMDGWLENFAYRISIGWEVFIASAAVTLFVAVVTVSLQSLRASLANPVESLRNE
jgi:hypothetical protein